MQINVSVEIVLMYGNLHSFLMLLVLEENGLHFYWWLYSCVIAFLHEKQIRSVLIIWIFVQFYHMVQTKFGKPSKRLHCDNGRDYINQDLSKFLKEQYSPWTRVLILANKVMSWKEKIITYLKWHEPCYSKCLFLNLIGGGCLNYHLSH